MAEHTPTPWFKNSKFEVGPRPRTDDQNDGMLHAVADVFGDNREANAALIVKAVNSHYAMVRALEDIAAMDPKSIRADDLGRAARIASAVLSHLRADVGGSGQ